ncbi:MAG: hypothetical protein AB7F86_05385 [Bdellovibrionales bacterium]
MFKKSLYLSAIVGVLVLSLVACKSAEKLGETETVDTSMSESMELADASVNTSDVTPEPDTTYEEPSQELAQNDVTPQTTAPVESLGASSSGLGR